MSDAAIEAADDAAKITQGFESLLDYLKRSRGFDFTGYKRTGLMRRVDKQMATVGLSVYSDYIDYLEVYPDEFSRLFNAILINVTTFFRDASAWDYLATEIIPHLCDSNGSGERQPLRFWSAGCASGEETYSLAILLAEHLGMDQFRERVKIYATDIDEEALTQARAASYSHHEIAGVPEALLQKYFETDGTRYILHKNLRRCVIFGRHNLLQDAPISRIDMLVCRNTLMYFNSEVQATILNRFHFAVNNGGYLFLGKAEMMFTHAGLFLALDLKRRIFTKMSRGNMRERLLLMTQNEGMINPVHDSPERLREMAFNAGMTAQVIIDFDGTLAMANERAAALFHISAKDMGRPLRDLELSYRPIELRSLIEQAYTEKRTVTIKEATWANKPGDPIALEILIVPLLDNGEPLGISISFNNVTRARRLQDDLQTTNRELETTNEELQSTNEELETTNEELQSTNEELETTNEELQSTNEELETTNQELQSTNEELQTVNAELRQLSDELNQVNAYLESILTSMRSAVVVLDTELRVQIWNNKAQDLWGLRADEVQGQHFLNLDIGLPVAEITQAVRDCLSNTNAYHETVLAARNRRGKSIHCKVIATPLIGTDGDSCGVILLMEESQDKT